MAKKICEQLIDVYDGSGMKEEYKQELIFYTNLVEDLDLNYVFKLKGICSKEEWESYLDVILKRLDNISLKLELLNHERLYEDMLDLILDSKDVMYMDQYESVLKGLFPERVLEFYIHFLKQEVEFVRDRKKYRCLIIYLKNISSIEGGYEEACHLANEWRHVYYRRKAMIEELKQAGF